MGKKRHSNDIDHQDGSQASTQQHKKRRKQPPEPWPLPDYTPMHIQPISPEHEVCQLPQHINAANTYEILSLFFKEELLETMAKHTNEYAAIHRGQELYKHPRPWKDTTARELMAFLAVYIWMGLHPEHDVAEYWTTEDSHSHKIVRKHISLFRWQQLDRFFHISKPTTAKETPFDKIEPLNEELRIAVKEYWNPTTSMAVDEAMQRFMGRAKETVNIPLKPTPEGFKIWVLANVGYILDWLFHARGTGPVDLDKVSRIFSHPSSGTRSTTPRRYPQRLQAYRLAAVCPPIPPLAIARIH